MTSRGLVIIGLVAMLASAPETLAAQQPTAKAVRYKITDLGTLPSGNFSQATFVADNRLVTGISTTSEGTQHAVAWYRGSIFDLGSLLGGRTAGHLVRMLPA